MFSSLTTGMRLEVRPRHGEGEPASALVFDDQHALTIRFRRALPQWCSAGTELLATPADDGARPVRWTLRVDRLDLREQFATLTVIEEPQPLERRRAERPVAPIPIEWSQPPDRRRQAGVGVDLNRLGLRFRADVDVRLDRIVLALVLPSGAITAQGQVVGVSGNEVRVEFVALHPEALRRLVAWEAQLLVEELAPPTAHVGATSP